MDRHEFFSEIIKTFGGPDDVWVRPRQLKNTKPLTTFDAIHGTKFSHQYKLPYNLTSDSLWIVITAFFMVKYSEENEKKFKELLKKIFLFLQNNHKEFEGLDSNIIDVLQGVASEISPIDIRDYIISGGFSSRPKIYKELYDAIDKKSRVRIGCVPATSTLMRMAKHFRIV